MRPTTMCRLMACCAALCAGRTSAAVIPNGGFETNITGFWSTAGDVTIANSPFDVWNATEGSKFAAMSTDSLSDTDFPMPGANVPFTSNEALFGDDLEAALILPFASLSSLNAAEGSGILSNSFIAPAGTLQLLVDFEFLTNELDPPPPDLGSSLNDFAFYSIDGAEPVIFYDAFGNFGPVTLSGANDYFKNDSGLAQTLVIPLGPGTHTVAFGIADFADNGFNSGLFIDNVRLSVVPEPSGLALMAAAALLLPGLARLRRVRRTDAL